MGPRPPRHQKWAPVPSRASEVGPRALLGIRSGAQTQAFVVGLRRSSQGRFFPSWDNVRPRKNGMYP